ncbi:MAG: NAD(P)H-binding protein [Bacteroidota bacterium]
MKALIIGATGATGKDLVNVLLQDPEYTEVVTFVRRPSGITVLKLSEVITDFDQLESVSDHINGAVLFSCLGTTLKAAGSKEKQQHIDYEIPLQFAEIAKRNGVSGMVLLSAYGATADSRVFYSRIKGMLEDEIGKLGFTKYIIFKPGLLVRKNTDRVVERISAGVLNFLNGIGLVKKFKPLPTEVLAEKLAKSPKIFGSGRHVVVLSEIFGL